MNRQTIMRRLPLLLFFIMLTMLIAACNLGAPADEPINLTSQVTGSPDAAPTRTTIPDVSTTQVRATVTQIPIPTRNPNTGQVIFPTSVSFFRTPLPTNTPAPASIVILSPVPGNVVSGNMQILGSAIHPQFLQYRLEFGPDPNPGNLWFPITGIAQTPVLNNRLGIWNTSGAGSPDGTYQLRLRVFLRDGSQQTTVVNNIRVQNQAPTPIPTSTPAVPRP
ncbi:MAG: hypothetical protein ACPG7F_19970, partial [Aggregatilineales bacterium]